MARRSQPPRLSAFESRSPQEPTIKASGRTAKGGLRMPDSRCIRRETRRMTGWAAISLLFYATASFAQGTPPVLLRVPDQQEPPGGLLAMKVMLTEHSPIIRASMALAFGPSPLGSIQDVALFSPTGNVSGTAVIDGGGINIVFNAPDGTLGTGVE